MDNWKPWSGLKQKKKIASIQLARCFGRHFLHLAIGRKLWNGCRTGSNENWFIDWIDLSFIFFHLLRADGDFLLMSWSIRLIHCYRPSRDKKMMDRFPSDRRIQPHFPHGIHFQVNGWNWMREIGWEISISNCQRKIERKPERKKERTGRRNSSGAGNRSRRIRNWLNQKPDICYGHFDWWTVQFRNGFIVNYRVAPRHLTIPPFHSISWSENHSSSNVKSELGGPETHRMVRAIGSHWNDNEWLIWSINTFNVVGHGPGPTTSRPRPA